jgi:hypothetical protein
MGERAEAEKLHAEAYTLAAHRWLALPQTVLPQNCYGRRHVQDFSPPCHCPTGRAINNDLALTSGLRGISCVNELEVVTVARLNAGTIIAAMVAILLSLAGAFLARQLLISEAPPVVPPEEPKVTIPVATTDLPAGRELKRGDIGTLVVTKAE